ncbi:hypothetical protein CAPTEDRAFT_142373, partial [Capitella teleta]
SIQVTFILIALILVFMPISGSFFNPVGCFVSYLDGRISMAKAILYSIAEISGAATAVLLLRLRPSSMFTHPLRPAESITPVQGVMVEAVLTLFLIFMVMAVTDDAVRKVYDMNISLVIAFTAGSMIISSGSYTGAAMNPLIALGPAVSSADFSDHWVYWIGPFIGGTVGYALYAGVRFGYHKGHVVASSKCTCFLIICDCFMSTKRT